MPLIWPRDAASDIANAKDAFSSWDACMSKTYCKWPVIAAIIVGSLIVFSILFCLARCICCGAECCCGCLTCCNACCPSGSRNKNSGYQQPPGPPPQAYNPYGQYQSPVPPAYNPNQAYGGAPKTAVFDAPSKNDDALPAMPSWDDARTRRIEQEHLPQYEQDVVEMDKMDRSGVPQQQHLLGHQPAHRDAYGDDHYYNDQHHNTEDHTGYGYSEPRAHDYDHYRQTTGSPVSTANGQYNAYGQSQAYSSPYHSQETDAGPYASPTDTYMHGASPPSYRTGPPSLMSPVGASVRKPVNGSWRNV